MYAILTHAIQYSQGDVQEAVRACVTALNIRTRVLGNHADTALSNKTLAYLLLKCGQPDEALRYCDMALEIYEKLRADDALKMAVRQVMAQAHSRQVALAAAADAHPATKGCDVDSGADDSSHYEVTDRRTSKSVSTAV